VDELNGRMIACQILLTGLIAKVANNSPEPLRFLTEFRDEVRAVINQIRISGPLDTAQVRQSALATADELFGLMKPPSTAEAEDWRRQASIEATNKKTAFIKVRNLSGARVERGNGGKNERSESSGFFAYA
jgi:hypothetical protein